MKKQCHASLIICLLMSILNAVSARVRYYGKLAQGNGGQKIYVFEEQNLVVVTTAGHYNVQSPINEIVATYILPSFNKK